MTIITGNNSQNSSLQQLLTKLEEKHGNAPADPEPEQVPAIQLPAVQPDFLSEVEAVKNALRERNSQPRPHTRQDVNRRAALELLFEDRLQRHPIYSTGFHPLRLEWWLLETMDYPIEFVTAELNNMDKWLMRTPQTQRVSWTQFIGGWLAREWKAQQRPKEVRWVKK